MDKTKKYQDLQTQLHSLILPSDNIISKMANFSRMYWEAFEFHWVGFYIVDSEKQELYLGPFQGPTACTQILKGKGVCGTSWSEAKTLIVDDVHKFPGHIACSALSKSEIVVPVIKERTVVAVLDIDSDEFSSFDKFDQKYLETFLNDLF
ncbi:MAG: GAF domain-containing protein [Bdellovibrionales bacterium]